MDRTKFNVDKDKGKRSCNGVVFDSQLEMRYYRDVLLPRVESGEVLRYELQKKYILQDGFERNGKKILPITYVADFYIEYSDGHIEVIDIKGCPDNLAKLKRKMFWFRYPEIYYQWVSYIKKFGGWGLYDDFNCRRKAEKKIAWNKKESAHNGQND